MFDFPDLQGADTVIIEGTEYVRVRVFNTLFLVSMKGDVINGRGNKTRISGFGYAMSRSPSGWLYHHVVVCTVFHGCSPGDNFVVNHKDRNKLNNDPENLEWITHGENIRHGYKAENVHGPWLGKKGIDHPLSHSIRAERNGEVRLFHGQSEAARELGLHQRNIWSVLNGKRGTTGGWRFFNV